MPFFVQVVQLASLQAPVVQVAAPRQPAQVAPPLPHLSVAVPAWHAPAASQQPEQLWAQLTEPPPAPPLPPVPPPAPPPNPLTHTLEMQDSLRVQMAHALPPLPHAAVLDTAWHLSVESQQPLQLATEHLATGGLHAGANSMTTPIAKPATSKRTCFIFREPL